MASSDSDDNNKIATILATIGTVFWCIQLIPQIWKNYRRKSTDGFPVSMMILWAAAGVFYGMYFIAQSADIALQVQPQIFTALCLITWAQCLYYGKGYSVKKAIAFLFISSIVGAGLQVAAAIPIRNSPHYQSDPSPYYWPILMLGIFAAVCLAGGLVPPYFELAKHHGQAIGISLIFLSIDASGALLSFASLWFPQNKADGSTGYRDYVGMVIYLVDPIMEAGIVLIHFTWWLRIGRHTEKITHDEERALKEEKV
ncbi:PQ loop repeat-domain-containing protein [Myxozyma melibiosi]|uniref:PQ loop repeat-domain-containing protein n=1 Tax=Myxozyma melibiosi TaxID=54550 RepID=A0ABR1FFJ3_9ASCO